MGFLETRSTEPYRRGQLSEIPVFQPNLARTCFSSYDWFVIDWPAVLGFVYVGAFVTGFVLSFTIKQRSRRFGVRIATAILAVPIVLIGILSAVLRLTIFTEPPTLAELRSEFQSKRPALETIVRMSDEDQSFSRVASNFFWADAATPGARLSEPRWELYREVFSRTGVKLGLQRDGAGNVFIIVDSVGLLNRGHATGFLYCQSTKSVNGLGFYPCFLNQEIGHRDYDPRTRDEAYSFRKLDNRWYAYDEGPS
jgi:hypothetical protein